MSGTWRAYVGDGAWRRAPEIEEVGLTWEAAAARLRERLEKQPDEPTCPSCQWEKDQGLELLRSDTPQRVFAEVDGTWFVLAPDDEPMVDAIVCAVAEFAGEARRQAGNS